MLQKLSKLIDVKSIVTILMTAVFCILAVVGKVSAEQFVTIFTTVIAFYFGTQNAKTSESTKSKGDDV